MKRCRLFLSPQYPDSISLSSSDSLQAGHKGLLHPPHPSAIFLRITNEIRKSLGFAPNARPHVTTILHHFWRSLCHPRGFARRASCRRSFRDVACRPNSVLKDRPENPRTLWFPCLQLAASASSSTHSGPLRDRRGTNGREPCGLIAFIICGSARLPIQTPAGQLSDLESPPDLSSSP